MRYITVLLLLLGVTSAHSQSKFNSDSFDVTKEDLELNVFEKDSTANALVIYEVGESDVNSRTLNIETEVKKKVKILNKKGFSYGEVIIPLFEDYSGDKESIKNIKATVYNLVNGSIEKTRLKKAAIFEEDASESLKTIKIVFPKIKEGSVVVYSYTKISPFLYKYKGWSFQSDIPKLYSEYNASIPSHFEYHAKLVGNLEFTSKEITEDPYCTRIPGSNAICNVSKYIMKDIPAFIVEDYITTKDNYLSRIEYELKSIKGYRNTKHITKTWQVVDNQILKDTSLGHELIQTTDYKNLISEDITSLSDPLEKAKKIFEYVQSNYKWNGGKRAFDNISTKYLVEHKTGNVGDINMLLYLLLNEFEIDVQLIVLSTRENGFATVLYPVISDFNYLIIKAVIDGKTYLLDATSNYVAFGEVPFRCLNQYGRVLDFANGSSWYEIKIEDTSLMQYSYELSIDKDQNITANVDFESTGYHALPIKERYFEDSEKFIHNFKNEFDFLEFSKFEVITKEKISDSFKSSFEVQNTAEIIGNNIYLNPVLLEFFPKNPFRLQERSYPIDFGYKDTYIYKIKVNVDDSYNILEIPQNLNLSLPGREASVRFSVQQKNNEVLLYFKLSFSQAIYPPNYYEALKEIMTKVIDIQNNSIIVLEKKQ
ncbi:DUF3857 domain-containing protein [uncultured Psychroserpens sp.]|uniref:DUF3857 domain-containing protein n=1 Tax=uncultured Psychroserpens sp. TaxID=255436 RepID=UPI0026102DCB|nr:DUF3857 domain-containing protein [uncultured Psychroserpens sp.]